MIFSEFAPDCLYMYQFLSWTQHTDVSLHLFKLPNSNKIMQQTKITALLLWHTDGKTEFIPLITLQHRTVWKTLLSKVSRLTFTLNENNKLSPLIWSCQRVNNLLTIYCMSTCKINHQNTELQTSEIQNLIQCWK